uniref:BED-type domain-containing protein n=1 Tax=Panagrolaimus sp. PS1159 TaxID=55785 RepID=A0AC35GW70_9BILA
MEQSTQDVEVSQFETPRRFVTPTSRRSINNEDKLEIVRKWKTGMLDTKPVLKNNYVQIVEDSKVTGHICIHCEQYFIGNRIGGTQRNHKCIRRPPTFTTAQKQMAKDSSLNMIKTDLLPFAVVQKPGLLGFAKTMIEIGADLGTQVTKCITLDDVKCLLPHPTTLSNHINSLTTKKPQLYAILKRKSSDSGLSIMIDGTSKTFHYSNLTF